MEPLRESQSGPTLADVRCHEEEECTCYAPDFQPSGGPEGPWGVDDETWFRDAKIRV